MRTVRTKVYQFNELDNAAKQKAIEWANSLNINTDDFDTFIKEEFTEHEEFFTIDKVYYSGFWSQGDGAMFEYSGINKDFVNTIIDGLKLTNWKKNVLKNCIYVSGNGKQSGHYSHEKSCSHNIHIENNFSQDLPNIDSLIELYSSEIEEAIIDKYEDLARELYKSLENEYEYQTSEEVIIETITANEYEFTKYGNRF